VLLASENTTKLIRLEIKLEKEYKMSYLGFSKIVYRSRVSLFPGRHYDNSTPIC
jgi:hypothetical protein